VRKNRETYGGRNKDRKILFYGSGWCYQFENDGMLNAIRQIK
jgi:hypothetical protein